MEHVAAAQVAVVDYVNNFEWVTGETPFTSVTFLVTIHVLYVSALWVLSNYMQHTQTPPWVRAFAFYHNALMSALSLLMLVGLIAGAYMAGRFGSWDSFACHPPQRYVGLLPFSMYIFYLTKALEFIDTFLLVLSKKPLIWLHKIHHLTTMTLVWHAMHVSMPSDITCGGLNCFVHVIMYLYFAYPIRMMRQTITALQLSQFVIALGVIGYAAWLRLATEHEPCRGTEWSEAHGLVMYGVYLGTFLNFFIQQYISQPSKKTKSDPTTAATTQAQQAMEFNVNAMSTLATTDYATSSAYTTDIVQAARVLFKAFCLAAISVAFATSASVYLQVFGVIVAGAAMSMMSLIGQQCKEGHFFEAQWANFVCGLCSLVPAFLCVMLLWHTHTSAPLTWVDVAMCVAPYIIMTLNTRACVPSVKGVKGKPSPLSQIFPELYWATPTVLIGKLDDLQRVALYKYDELMKGVYSQTKDNTDTTTTPSSQPSKPSLFQRVWSYAPPYVMMREMLYWQRRDLLLVVVLLLCVMRQDAVSLGVCVALMLCGFVMRSNCTSLMMRMTTKRAPPKSTKDNLDGEKKTVLIDGRVYDVTDFMKRHPGGSVIGYGVGTDATNAFTAFHLRSKKASQILKSLSSTPVEGAYPNAQAAPAPTQSTLVKDFAEFNAQLIAEGWYAPSPLHTLYRISELLVMHALGFYLVFFTPFWPVGLVVLGITQGRCGWLMHEAGHYSLTTSIPVDRFLQVILYGCGCGMSASFWRNQHNKHHATPQRLRHDPDLDTLPLVAFNDAILSRLPANSFFRRVWIPMQAYVFTPVITVLVSLMWQFYLHPRHSLRIGHYFELLTYAIRYVVWYYLFSYFGWSLSATIAAYVMYTGVGGAYIFTNFAVSHTHLPVLAQNDNVTWVEYAANHTTNCSNHFFVNWWMAYLNFQIEHHLFPSMPQYRFVELSPRVRKFFEEHGVQYDYRGYFEALSATFQNLKAVGEASKKNE